MGKVKKIKKSMVVEAQKRKKNILEFYYMTPEAADARELMGLVKSVDEMCIRDRISSL